MVPFSVSSSRQGELNGARMDSGPGNVILAGKHLLALSDKGELSVVEASPNYYNELARKN